MSESSHFLRWELHENPYRSLPGMFVLDDASDHADSRGITLVRVIAEALTTPKSSDPDPDNLLTNALTPWLETWAADDIRPLRWSRSIFTRNRFGRHRAASDVNSLRQLGIAARTFEDASAMESHALHPVAETLEPVAHTRRVGAGSLSLLAPHSLPPYLLLDRLIPLRAAHGERLRLQHCAEALTPLGVIVLSQEWFDGGEASREIAYSRERYSPMEHDEMARV